ncbi:MAG: hypothetical protein ACTSR8_04395 [Promethearchaeota archaeon]
MKINSLKQYRKISRDFKEKVELMKKTPLIDLEKMFSYYYDEGLSTYLRVEMERHPDMTEKEILIEMYKLSEKLKGKMHIK